MQDLTSILKGILLFVQFIGAFIGGLYLLKLKRSYWKWFSVYLILIFIQECFWTYVELTDNYYKILYFTLFGIPIQILFFYWLYALKSLKDQKLFLASIFVYIVSSITLFYVKNIVDSISLSSNIGSIILIILLILEFIKQIKNDDILKFKENKMFYINLGMILFYLGSYPYNVFGKELHENYKNIYDIYHIYFLASNCIMYLLFSASFLFGKTK